jgi:hypothetical protein
MANTDSYEYMNENSIAQDLMCPLCKNPLNEPVCPDQCGHTFCQKCITNAFNQLSQCPTCRRRLTLSDFRPITTRPFLNQLNQLLVKCKACSESNIERSNFSDHSKVCSKQLVSCLAENLKCEWKGCRDQIDGHMKQCPLIKVQPTIAELNAKIAHQSGQIRFLYTVLNRISRNHKAVCQENYRMEGSACCDGCRIGFTFAEHERRLHFCPKTDFCADCVEEFFP